MGSSIARQPKFAKTAPITEYDAKLREAAQRSPVGGPARLDQSDRREVLATRAVVDGATRVLMEQGGLSEREAFLGIQHRARRSRRAVRAVAEEVLGSQDKEGGASL